MQVLFYKQFGSLTYKMNKPEITSELKKKRASGQYGKFKNLFYRKRSTKTIFIGELIKKTPQYLLKLPHPH